jgi:ATP-dependent Lon protease
VILIIKIKPEYLEGLSFHYVKEMSEVLNLLTDQNKQKNARVL